MNAEKTRASGQPDTTIPGRTNQPLFWALLVTISLICATWGFFAPYPYNLFLWGLAGIAFITFLVLLRRSSRGISKIEATEVLRLIACDKCSVESEGPFQKGDYVFKKIGSCPRCQGTLYIKALYGVDEAAKVVKES